MTTRQLLVFLILVAAFLCACVTAAIGFGWLHGHDTQALGWVGATFALYIFADLLETNP